MTNWEPTEYNGQPARLYPDGSIRNEKGHWLARHPGGEENEITSANARAMQKLRIEKARAKVRERVTAEIRAIAPSVTLPEDAYAEIVAKQSLTLMDSEKPRFDDVEKLGQIMGLMPSRNEPADNGADTIDAATNLVREIARFVGSMAQDRIRADVVDADPVSGTGPAAGGGTLVRGDADSAGGE